MKQTRQGELVQPLPVADLQSQVKALRAQFASVVGRLALGIADQGSDAGDLADAAMQEIEASVATLQIGIRSHLPSCTRLELINTLQREVAHRRAVLRSMRETIATAQRMAGELPDSDGVNSRPPE
jgi:hypothetical protein